MEMPSSLARTLRSNFSPSPLQPTDTAWGSVLLFLRSFLRPLAVCLETCSSMACSEQIWVQWTSQSEITQPLEGGSSLPANATVPPVMHSPKCRGLCMVRRSTFSPSALFSTVQQLWLCVFGFTTPQKRACCHLCSCGDLYDQTMHTTEFGSKIILIPLGD